MKYGKILCTLITGFGITSTASAFDESSYLRPGAEISLSIENYRQQLQHQANTNQSTIQTQRLKLTAYESPYQWLQGGLHIGYLNASHDDQLWASGTLPSGQFVGIQLRKPQHQPRQFELHWSLAYSYNRLKGDQTTTATTLSWHDLNAELGLIINRAALRFSLGKFFARIEGTEQRTLTTNTSSQSSNQRFNSLNNSGSYASIGYKTSHNGRIELIARSGAQRGAALFFSHQF
ncbi:MAG: hypothetical protein L3J62_09635 [Gammaproteobacteria bacterium]|nr:hypothetical protein [Gammaproteobacteria bacterium]MCF6231027.1 hypothetical protein [Gammaproteobacteria bacterium]